eukprot:TRINITY_DN19796_c0_g1_i1.p1 TRINITY_DN19796_c0_g1~~TRINITY_DN19796_c0_g1_i1.p1  ORF type:complete len:316 (-),score=63.32 TRINITY_DN19796_c0_g1_i1:48-995(-)
MWTWHQSAFRIKDPKVSVPFYEKNFGMTLINSYTGDKVSNYYLTTVLPDTTVPGEVGSKERDAFLWNYSGTVLQLVHNHGTEKDDACKFNNGNVEPDRGFGHIAFHCKDVYEACDKLEADGIKFQKKPNDGRMKGLAFALDPDGYWIEIISRNATSPFAGLWNLAQTMIRVKDPKKSMEFYKTLCGMTCLRELHFEKAKFSLFFMASIPADKKAGLPDPTTEAARDYIKDMWNPVLELTHNHGTEDDDKFSYHNGNTDPKGFSHIGFLVDDVASACKALTDAGYKITAQPDAAGVAYAADPDNYRVAIIPRGGKK